MTGQVKEDVLCRFGELGVYVRQGRLHFNPRILYKKEFLSSPCMFLYFNTEGEPCELSLESGSLGFTYCQIPVVYTMASQHGIQVLYKDHTKNSVANVALDYDTSHLIFRRTGEIVKIVVDIDKSILL